jgi:hypothetical protein
MSRALGLSVVGKRREASHAKETRPRSHSAWLMVIPQLQEF